MGMSGLNKSVGLRSIKASSSGPGRPIRLGHVHTHMSNPRKRNEKSGNTVAIWLVQELADRHNVAAKDIWKQLSGICIARAIKNDMVLILN